MSGMNTAFAISALADLISASATIALKLQRASDAIMRARAEGREVNEDDWANVTQSIASAEDELQAAIDSARNINK